MTNTPRTPRTRTTTQRAEASREARRTAETASAEPRRAPGELSMDELEQVVGGGGRAITSGTWLTRTGIPDDGI